MLAYDEVAQDQHRRDDAVLLEENRLRAATRAARYQQALCCYHSRRVHAPCFEEGDLVLRRVQSTKGTNKLSPKWEGPYRVVRVTRCQGKRHLWDPEDPYYGWRERSAAQRAGLTINARGFLPRFGPQMMRKSLVLLVCVYLVFFSSWTS